MEHINVNIIDKFFLAYSRNDLNGIKQVLSENVKWVFPGQNPLSGTKVGIEEVISFFDKMGGIMGKSNVKVEKMVIGANDNYVLECQHIRTNREEGTNFDQDMCVLWIFKDDKIIEGKHFISEQFEADSFFNKVF
ncbi:nuclear transport factor 2 family protein [Clostridium estertheticum]|uniref:nuclear transport factor 2 family protein n=1 Tax=Clostridium estertheticum TaxID=238834 RepID=UPI0013E9028B|nr:nuclear transport factor 2 family protein [Clostridium estertheticum]MBZ9686964.1 nuclear transport factor 2 family protein [Clostridium estertheticum]